MRIAFLLPCFARIPVGGYKVVYEYASRLQMRGHEVTIVHPQSPPPKTTWLDRGNFVWWRTKRRLVDGGRVPWFSLHPDVRLLFPPDLREEYVPEGEVLVATAWQTAEWSAQYSHSRGERVYWIADYEHFMSGSDAVRERMAATYRAGMINLVMSPVCGEMVRSCGGRVHAYIPIGLGFDEFGCDLAVDDEARRFVGFPVRPEPFKRTEDAMAALEIVRSTVGSDLRVWAFGGPAPRSIPAWIDYHERPGGGLLRTLYNRTSVFVVPSQFEGWGLPGSEAMACGAALASTDSGGVRAYAEHGKTALLSDAGDPRLLADNVLRLLADRELRHRIARQGLSNIQQFTWERATDSLEGVFLDRASRDLFS